MRHIDLGRPYQEICGGASGARYEQDGVLFGPTGDELHPLSPVAEAVPAVAPGEVALEDQHWRYLKAQVEMFGGTWTNKADALAFLRSSK